VKSESDYFSHSNVWLYPIECGMTMRTLYMFSSKNKKKNNFFR
jgi:hypothetical protein